MNRFGLVDGGLIQVAFGLAGGVGGRLAKGLIESVLASEVDGVGLAVMNLVWGHQADPEVVMVLIVPIKIIAQEASGILDAAEARGELRLVFQVLELAFGERVVAGRVRSAMR